MDGTNMCFNQKSKATFMGIDVRLENERGESLEILGDPDNLTEKLLADEADGHLVCLRFIDPYGDTLFNSLQLPILIEELGNKLKSVTDDRVRNHGVAIIALARKALAKTHLYVRFYDD